MSGSSEPREWLEGAAAARDARQVVAEQIAEGLREREMTGEEGAVALRLRQLREARATGDRDVLRAAVMELSLASAEWVVALDLAAAGTLPRRAPTSA